MALQLALQLGAGAVAQLSSTDLAAFYNSAASASGTTAGCTANDFADGNVIVANQADEYAGNQNVPVLFQFADTVTDAETVLNMSSVSNLQTFSSTVLQGFVDANDVSTIFDTDFKFANSLQSADIVSNGVKLAASVHGLQSGAISLAEVDNQVSIVAQLADGATAPSVATIVNHVENLIGYNIPSCLGIADASLSDLETAANSATTTTAGSRATYSFPVADLNITVAGYNSTIGVVTDSVVYFMALLANEPSVLFVEPTIQPQTRASECQVNPVQSFPLGDAKEVSQGFGVTGACQYMHDRSVDGAGEVVAIIDDGLYVDSTFFYAPNQEVFCAGVNPNTGDSCCPIVGTTANLTDCIPDGENTPIGVDLSADAQAALGVDVVVSSDGTRKIASYIPVADTDPASHGTAVTSVVVGSPLDHVSDQFECDEEADDVVGVASGARAVFVDVGAGADGELVIPYSNFQTLLDVAYATSGANGVTLAWGADTNGAPDAVSRDIDSFLVANSDSVVVSAAGLKSEPNGNTALAKNGISVGVYSQATSATLVPTFSVQLSTPVDAASSGVYTQDDPNSCAFEDFTGSSAAAAIVAGQTALIEQYLKQFVEVFHYDATASESISHDYTGSTIKALLVASANANCFGGEGSGNGFGVPVLDHVLPFDQEHQFDLRVEEHILTAVGTRERSVTVTDTSRPLTVALAYTDTAVTPFAAAGNGVVNNVRITVRGPATEASPNGVVFSSVGADGVEITGNSAVNAQRVVVETPVEGTYTISVEAAFLSAASAADQSVSLVITGRYSVASIAGDIGVTGQDPGEITDTPACCPWGTVLPTTSCFPISFIVLILIGVIIVGLAVICCIAAKCKVKDVEAAH